MDELMVIGYIVTAVITLGAFIGVIMKFIQPINELRVVIQELRDAIGNMRQNDAKRDARLDEHDKDIGNLKGRVGKIETKIELYHSDES